MNRSFGKLVDGKIEYAPSEIKIGNTYFPKPTAEQYLALGWKRIVDKRPETCDGGYWVATGWYEFDAEIEQMFKWRETKRTEVNFNRALERHLREERVARGYDEREPSDYKDSSIPRWAQDAKDWIAHRDEVMVYGLTILNEWKRTGIEPSYEEFVANLPKITWTEE